MLEDTDAARVMQGLSEPRGDCPRLQIRDLRRSVELEHHHRADRVGRHRGKTDDGSGPLSGYSKRPPYAPARIEKSPRWRNRPKRASRHRSRSAGRQGSRTGRRRRERGQPVRRGCERHGPKGGRTGFQQGATRKRRQGFDTTRPNGLSITERVRASAGAPTTRNSDPSGETSYCARDPVSR